MRKRIANVAAPLGALALAGALLAGAAALLDGARTAHAQESGGEQQQADAEGSGAETELTEWQKARIAEYQDAQTAQPGVSGQAEQGMISGLASVMNENTSDQFTVSATGLDPYFYYEYVFQVRSRTSDGRTHSRGGIGFDSQCNGVIESVLAPRRAKSHRATLTLYACRAGSYQVNSQLRLINHDEDPEDPERVTTLDTDIVTVTVRGTPTPTPPAPSNFRVTSTGQTSVGLAWNAQSQIMGFHIAGAPRAIYPSKSSTSATASNLRCGANYAFRIRAEGDNTNTQGWSPWSSYVSATTSACPTPTITISRNRASVTEGQSAQFTLRANHAPSSNLTVSVRVTQSGSFISGTPPTSVQISSGRTTGRLTVQTRNDSVDEPHGSITAQVRRGTGYSVGSPMSASVTVEDNEPDPPVEPPPTVTPPNKTPSFSTTISNKSWKRNKAISSFRLPAATGGDGTLTYSLNRALPNGVTRSNFTVRGTPSALKASTQYTWTATDRDGDTASLSFYITVVANKTPRFSATISNKSWTHNKAISSFRLPAATGGDGTLSYSLSPAPPSGVTRSNFTVRGTPNALKTSTQYTWTATDADGDTATRSFNIEVLPQVTIAAGTSPIAEGTTAQFTLTASAAPPSNLKVNVHVTQRGTFISGTPPKSVTIPANGTTATLSVPTLKDKVNEADGSVSAEVQTGTGYAVGSTLPVSVSVRDTPYVSIAAGPSITEGANATFTITAAGAPPSNLAVSVSVSQSSFISGTPPKSVTIPANGTSATLTVATENDSTDEPNGSITASISANAAYELGSAFRASVNVQDNDVELATPTGLTVTPLPQRKARLSWAMISGAPKYHVEVKGGGSSKVFILTHNLNPQVTYDIALDSILDGKGLADATAYQFRVKAIYDDDTSDASDPYVDSDYSAIVEVRDTPITSINGDSSGRADGKGQAVVTWGAVPGATAYTLRWRELPDHQVSPPRPGTGGLARFGRYVDHANTDWRPQAAGATDWNYPAGASSSGMTVGGLNLGEIYAFQLTYTNASGQGFAARESYVWPSKGFPSDRVATYPFFGHWPGKIFPYTICLNTFPSETQNEWFQVINKAFEAWELGILVTQYSISRNCDSTTPMGLVEAHGNNVNEVIMASTDTGFQAFRAEANQIIGIDNLALFALKLLKNRGETFALPLCLFYKSDTPACVISPAYTAAHSASTKLNEAHGSVDILIRGRDADQMPQIPTSIQFNTCTGSYYEYELILHEAGHALGISGYDRGSVLASESSQYIMAHPTIDDSVLNYAEFIQNKDEPDCSLYPFDIMAIHALYQSVN